MTIKEIRTQLNNTADLLSELSIQAAQCGQIGYDDSARLDTKITAATDAVQAAFLLASTLEKLAKNKV